MKIACPMRWAAMTSGHKKKYQAEERRTQKEERKGQEEKPPQNEATIYFRLMYTSDSD